MQTVIGLTKAGTKKRRLVNLYIILIRQTEEIRIRRKLMQWYHGRGGHAVNKFIRAETM